MSARMTDSFDNSGKENVYKKSKLLAPDKCAEMNTERFSSMGYASGFPDKSESMNFPLLFNSVKNCVANRSSHIILVSASFFHEFFTCLVSMINDVVEGIAFNASEIGVFCSR